MVWVYGVIAVLTVWVLPAVLIATDDEPFDQWSNEDKGGLAFFTAIVAALWPVVLACVAVGGPPVVVGRRLQRRLLAARQAAVDAEREREFLEKKTRSLERELGVASD